MSPSPSPLYATYPRGFLDFLTQTPERGHRVGDFDMLPAGMERLNAALRALSPESPALTLDQFAAAAQRALDRYPDGSQPAFVTSRLDALRRVAALMDDPGWDAGADLLDCFRTVHDYMEDPAGLLPDDLPVVGRLDDAVLIDVALQLHREELADYEDFCRFRRVAADYASVPVAETGITRDHWMQALGQSRGRPAERAARRRYAPDPRTTLFHVS